MIHVHYISTSQVSEAETDGVINSIVAASILHNARAAITGGLIYARGHFSQVIEGPMQAVDALMARIAQDPRHRDCVVIDRRPITARAFPSWSLAYRGGSIFVAASIERAALGAQRGDPAEIRTLVRLMAAFGQVTAARPPA